MIEEYRQQCQFGPARLHLQWRVDHSLPNQEQGTITGFTAWIENHGAIMRFSAADPYDTGIISTPHPIPELRLAFPQIRNMLEREFRLPGLLRLSLSNAGDATPPPLLAYIDALDSGLT